VSKIARDPVGSEVTTQAAEMPGDELAEANNSFKSRRIDEKRALYTKNNVARIVSDLTAQAEEDGTISAQTVYDLMIRDGTFDASELIAKIDSDNNNKLDVAEVISWYFSKDVTNQKIAHGMAEKAFKKFDADSNGELDHLEFFEACKELKVPGGISGHMRCLQAMDIDGDKTISLKEFKVFYFKHAKALIQEADARLSAENAEAVGKRNNYKLAAANAQEEALVFKNESYDKSATNPLLESSSVSMTLVAVVAGVAAGLAGAAFFSLKK
jgi:Ca2+-binding EF-hand superfamily protein